MYMAETTYGQSVKGQSINGQSVNWMNCLKSGSRINDLENCYQISSFKLMRLLVFVY